VTRVQVGPTVFRPRVGCPPARDAIGRAIEQKRHQVVDVTKPKKVARRWCMLGGTHGDEDCGVIPRWLERWCCPGERFGGRISTNGGACLWMLC
jgi:hypothetical protein